MKAYKGFNRDMTCTPADGVKFQFEEGKTYEEQEAALCEKGFHACTDPLDVFKYYSPADMCQYHEVELEDVAKGENNDDSKVCGKKITIGAKLGIKGIVEAFVQIVLENTKKKNKTSGDRAKIGSSGDRVQIGSSGNGAKIGSSGNRAQIGSSGNGAQIGSSGNWAQIGSSGDGAKIGSSGNGAQIGSSGNGAQIGSSGNWAQIGSSGDGAKIGSSGNGAQIGSSGNGAQIDVDGKNSVAMCAGNGGRIKAKAGCWIALAEWESVGDQYMPVCVKSAQVDGKTIKADTWYTLKGGEFVETKGTAL